MIKIIKSDAFEAWVGKLRDRKAIIRIEKRIRQMELGNLGDVKSVGESIGEARIHYGPGYRLYFLQRGETLIVLLAGGDKSTQDRELRKQKN